MDRLRFGIALCNSLSIFIVIYCLIRIPIHLIHPNIPADYRTALEIGVVTVAGYITMYLAYKFKIIRWHTAQEVISEISEQPQPEQPAQPNGSKQIPVQEEPTQPILAKKFLCTHCGKEFTSVQGKVCTHCNKPQNAAKLPESHHGDSIADIFGPKKDD